MHSLSKNLLWALNLRFLIISAEFKPLFYHWPGVTFTTTICCLTFWEDEENIFSPSLPWLASSRVLLRSHPSALLKQIIPVGLHRVMCQSCRRILIFILFFSAFLLMLRDALLILRVKICIAFLPPRRTNFRLVLLPRPSTSQTSFQCSKPTFDYITFRQNTA